MNFDEMNGLKETAKLILGEDNSIEINNIPPMSMGMEEFYGFIPTKNMTGVADTYYYEYPPATMEFVCHSNNDKKILDAKLASIVKKFESRGCNVSIEYPHNKETKKYVLTLSHANIWRNKDGNFDLR